MLTTNIRDLSCICNKLAETLSIRNNQIIPALSTNPQSPTKSHIGLFHLIQQIVQNIIRTSALNPNKTIILSGFF
jgi:hypothetical protein